MPAESKKQQRFMGMVHATQKGDIKAPSKAVAEAASSMSKSDAKDFAETKHKGLPEKKGAPEDMLAAAITHVRTRNRTALGNAFSTLKQAMDEVSVRKPDVGNKTDGNVPSSKPREQEADAGRTSAAPDPAPDTKPDQSSQVQTVQKGASIPAPVPQKTPSTDPAKQIPPVPQDDEGVGQPKVAFAQLDPRDQVYLLGIKAACDARGVPLSQIMQPALAWDVHKAAIMAEKQAGPNSGLSGWIYNTFMRGAAPMAQAGTAAARGASVAGNAARSGAQSSIAKATARPAVKTLPGTQQAARGALYGGPGAYMRNTQATRAARGR